MTNDMDTISPQTQQESKGDEENTKNTITIAEQTRDKQYAAKYDTGEVHKLYSKVAEHAGLQVALEERSGSDTECVAAQEYPGGCGNGFRSKLLQGTGTALCTLYGEGNGPSASQSCSGCIFGTDGNGRAVETWITGVSGVMFYEVSCGAG